MFSESLQLKVLSSDKQVHIDVFMYGSDLYRLELDSNVYAKGYIMEATYKGVSFVVGIAACLNFLKLKLPGTIGVTYYFKGKENISKLDTYLNQTGITTLDPALIKSIEEEITVYCVLKLNKFTNLTEYVGKINKFLDSTDRFSKDNIQQLHIIFDGLLTNERN